MTEPVTVTEWGVRYQYRDSDHVERYGSDQDTAARQAESYATITVRPLQKVTLVRRQVTTTPWEEVTGVSEPGEAEAIAAEQDADAEASQDDDHDNNPAH